jgi:hypothetical protein
LQPLSTLAERRFLLKISLSGLRWISCGVNHSIMPQELLAESLFVHNDVRYFFETTVKPTFGQSNFSPPLHTPSFGLFISPIVLSASFQRCGDFTATYVFPNLFLIARSTLTVSSG